jgi:hypothetical protein
LKTLLDTPEEARQVYGIIWDVCQEEPYTEFSDLEEAKEVAKASHGYIVTRRVEDWTPLPAEAL